MSYETRKSVTANMTMYSDVLAHIRLFDFAAKQMNTRYSNDPKACVVYAFTPRESLISSYLNLPRNLDYAIYDNLHKVIRL